MFDNYENEIRENTSNLEQMQLSYNNGCELLNVLQRGSSFFSLGPRDELHTDNSATSGSSSTSDTAASLLGSGAEAPSSALQSSTQRQGGLGYITGVIGTDKKNTFNLLLYRATRGNMISKFSEIEELLTDPATGKQIQKTVFIVFFSSERVREKIKKLCESLGAHIHPFPEGDVTQEIAKLRDTRSDLETVGAYIQR